MNPADRITAISKLTKREIERILTKRIQELEAELRVAWESNEEWAARAEKAEARVAELKKAIKEHMARSGEEHSPLLENATREREACTKADHGPQTVAAPCPKCGFQWGREWEAECAIDGKPVKPGQGMSAVVTGKKSKTFPGYYFSIRFCKGHTAKEKLDAMQAASKRCEDEAVRTGAYIRWRF